MFITFARVGPPLLYTPGDKKNIEGDRWITALYLHTFHKVINSFSITWLSSFVFANSRRFYEVQGGELSTNRQAEGRTFDLAYLFHYQWAPLFWGQLPGGSEHSPENSRPLRGPPQTG